MSSLILCYRNCYSCIFGYCEECDGNGADIEEAEIYDMFRGLIIFFGCDDPGPLHIACKCADRGHPGARSREDKPKDPLAVSPSGAIVITSDLL